MKTYNFASKIYKDNDNTATYYITSEGDIVDNWSEIDMEFDAPVAEVIVDGFFVGSLDEMRQSALRKYQEATK